MGNPSKYHPPIEPAETVDLTVAMEGLSRHSQRAYVRHLTHYLAAVHKLPLRQINLHHLSTDMARASLTPMLLRGYLDTLKLGNLSASTLSQARTAILWLADFLALLHREDAELSGALRRVRVPKAQTGKKVLKWLTAEDIKLILQVIPTMTDLTPAAIDRNLCIVALIATTGLRREEVATAMWSDLIKMGGHWVLVVHGKGEQLRHVKLPRLFLDALNRWTARHPLPDGDRAIFSQIWKGGAVTSGSLSPKAIWEIVEAAAGAAGIEGITPHVLRRTFARGAFEGGASFELIRQSLGHQSVITTERYVNALLELDNAATDVWAAELEDEDGRK